MNPKFSIVIPVYNRRDYLAQAIRSCLGQTTSDFEVLVSDDCSTDDLRALVDGFGDSRIRYLRSSSRLGAAKNHQHAVSLSRGSYVIALHSDDLLLPNCLESAGQLLDNCQGASAVYFSMTYLVGAEIHGFHPVPNLSFADKSIVHTNPWLEKFYGINPTCCLFRKSAFEELGGYRTSLRFVYDYDLYVRFMKNGGGVLFLPQILCVYRKHEEQAVQNATIDGLADVLDLWLLHEYSHWPASDIAELVLSQVGQTLRAGKSALTVFDQVRERGLGWRILQGMPKAIHRKLRRRLDSAHKADENVNYRSPTNVEDAMRAANALLSH